jgi:hypothetical protein
LPLGIFEGMRFPLALQLAELLTMGRPPALEDKMCAKLNGVQAKSQEAVTENAAKEGTEELIGGRDLLQIKPNASEKNYLRLPSIKAPFCRSGL